MEQKTSVKQAANLLVSRLSYSPTLNMEATCSAETSIDFQRTTLRYRYNSI
jgi:hypothetical protein